MFDSTSVASFTAFVATIVAHPAMRHGFRILGIIVVALLAQRFLDRMITRVIRRAVTPDRFIMQDEEQKREDTLIRIVDGSARFVVWFVAAYAVLTELGVSTTPFVTAAGVVGLAVSIGGQHAIRDIIIGACMMVEDQYRVGDPVRINGVPGTVRDVTLRLTVLCDDNDVIHYFPHGLITTVMNLRDHDAQSSP